MQTISFKNHTPTMVRTQKTKSVFCLSPGLDEVQKIWVAVREWESTLALGQAQERIAQLVAEEWAKADGRELLLINRIYSDI